MPKSPMMDRATTAKPMSQINFIEFIVGPLYANMVKIFPELSESAMHLLKNRKLFQQEHLLELERVEGKTLVEKTEEHTKMGNRFEKFKEKFKEKFQEMLVKNPRWAEEIDGNLQRVEQANRRSSRMVRGSIMGGGRRQSVSLWGGGKKGLHKRSATNPETLSESSFHTADSHGRSSFATDGAQRRILRGRESALQF